MSDEEVTAQDILSQGMSNAGVEGYFPISIVVVIEALGDDGQQYLITRRDTQSGAWKHLGMVEAAAGDIRAAMLEREDD